MQRRTFLRLTAATAIVPWVPLSGCDSDAITYGPFEAEVRARAEGLVLFDGSGRSYTIDLEASEILSNDAQGRSLGRIAENAALNAPTSVCATRDGTRFVLDRGTGSVLRLDENGRVDRLIGGAGDAPVTFAMPSDLDAGPDGLVYVADTLNHRIQVLDVEGRPVRSLGAPGVGPDELNAPRGVACARERVYVANSGNSRVDILSLDGAHLGSFEDVGQRFNPTGVATRGSGEVLVISTNECALYVFDGDGALVERRALQDADGRSAHPISISVDPQSGAVVIGALPGRAA